MPSFDVVSEFDAHEAVNAVDQANREVENRFDFKGSNSKFSLDDNVISLTSQSDFQLKQMLDVLRQKLAKRGIDLGCMDVQPPDLSGREARQAVILKQGIDQVLEHEPELALVGIDADRARKIVKQIKAAKMKVQAAIQGEKLRVSGKKRDDLQKVIAMLREEDAGLPLQYENFRD